VPLIVRLLDPPSVTDDRSIAAQRASPGQQRKRDLSHPGALLSSASDQCDKKNHGWREGPPVTVSWQSFDLLAGPSPSRQKSASNKKRIHLCGAGRLVLNQNIGRFKTTIHSVVHRPHQR